MVGGVAQLTLRGSVNGDSVDEVFDTADGKFDAVKPAGMANSGGDMDGAGTLDATDH
jgi:hypothetical protein